MNLKNIDFLVQSDGKITIGRSGPVGCAATASDLDQCLAMLVRRKGESLSSLLIRLDAAIEDALEREVYVDEVNDGAR